MTEDAKDLPPQTEAIQTEAIQPETAAAEETPPPAPRAPRGPLATGFLGGLAGGVAVTLLVVGGAAALWPQVSVHLSGGTGERLALLERQSDELAAKLAALQGGVVAPVGTVSADSSLSLRLAALEQRLTQSGVGDQLGALSAKSDQAAQDIQKMQAEMQALRLAIPPEGTILRLAERAESAEQAARDIAKQHANAQALLLVVGQLREAVDRGDAYDVELRAARRVAPADTADMLDRLSAFAANGIARRAALLDRFPALAPVILRATVAPDEDGFWKRLWNRLAGLVVIRKVDGSGNDTASVLARAEAAVRDADLNKAVKELTVLEEAPAQAASEWLKQAQARIDADKALSELAATALAATTKN